MERRLKPGRAFVRTLGRSALITALVSLALVSIPNSAHAATSAGAGGTINVGPSASVVVNALLPGTANDIQAINFGSETITAIITASAGTVAVTQSTGLAVPTGYQTTVTTPAATIGIYGSVANVNAALNTLTYSAGPSTGTATISVSISDRGSGAIAYDPSSGFYFQAVTSSTTWQGAYNAITGDTLTTNLSPASVTKRRAQTATGSGATLCAYVFNGMCGYFATIYNSAQDAFVTSKVGTIDAWLGGSDRVHEGQWVWADPKAPAYGLQFSDQYSGYTGQRDQSGSIEAGTGSNVTGQATSYQPGGTGPSYSYVQWNNNEPNNYNGNENALQIVSGGNGNWNDLPETGSSLTTYIVEYGGNGETLTYPSASSTINVNIAYVPTVYLSTTSGSSNVTYRATSSLTATINPAGRITFYANGKAIPGCKNMAANLYTATCSTWRPAQQNTIRLTATLAPTNSSYPTTSSPIVVVTAAPRSTLR